MIELENMFLTVIIIKVLDLSPRLSVCMSDLHENKFKHNFQDCLNPICSCGLNIESNSHFLLHCLTFNDE